MPFNIPNKGFMFWPVGTGDSTTIRVDQTVYLQVDLHDMEQCDNGDETAWPIIDELIKILPTLNGKPYLSTFALTHPDQDHCRGFAELNKRVLISELWMSPRTFREYREKEPLCPDAEAFHKEAMRRVNATIKAGGDPGRGNRIRIIGYDTLLQENDFKGFPKEFLSVPGHAISILDGRDYKAQFRAFVHAPFKDDSYKERNDCSLAFQITLVNGSGIGRALLMGDLGYPIIRRIFNSSDRLTLAWNVLLAPHHCSKCIMYWRNDSGIEELKADIIRDMANAALDPGYIISSSRPIPIKNQPGDNPPHAIAKAQYLRIVPNEFICTHEHPNSRAPVPVVFDVTLQGLVYLGKAQSTRTLSDVLSEAGAGASSAPVVAGGFG
jgi:beta-lactamase superfamily II metal-dependent hydrolase